MFNNKVILVTGGTGSFGKMFIKTILERYNPKKVIVFSRDELKQFEMQQTFKHDALRFFIGDIRDKQRLHRAFEDVDIVIHAAALKQVEAAEYNPFEAIKTNVLGAENIINEAIDQNVERVIALSTDKAVNPVNLYGATKLCSDKLFIAGNNYVPSSKDIRFSVVRYGNVIGSRGSVVPLFLKQRETGTLTITDERMTRFWITLQQSVDFVISSYEMMKGGEIFVPKLKTTNIMDLAKAIGPDCETKVIGIRPGEKIHEVLVTEDESRNGIEVDDRYVLLSKAASNQNWKQVGRALPEGFIYSSDQSEHLNKSEIQHYLTDYQENIL